MDLVPLSLSSLYRGGICHACFVVAIFIMVVVMLVVGWSWSWPLGLWLWLWGWWPSWG